MSNEVSECGGDLQCAGLDADLATHIAQLGK